MLVAINVARLLCIGDASAGRPLNRPSRNDLGEDITMLKVKSIAVLVGTLFILAISSNGVAVAQSTIFNVPTADAIGKEKVHLEFNYLLQAPAPEAPAGATTPRTSIYLPRAVVGTSGNVEFGTNVSFVNTKGTGRTDAFFSPNVKWNFYNNEEQGVAASGGGILYTPINNRTGSDTFGMIYSNVSKKIQATYGPRLTAGAYGIVGSTDTQFGGPRAGALLAVEQPIHPRASFVADWVSGKNGFGYFTPGVAVSLPKNSQFKLGYSFGNNTYSSVTNRDENNRFLFVRYGITF